MEKAKILERLIKEQGYNLKSFAEKCGIPYTTLYGIIKNGVGRATMDNILIICKNLGIKVEELEEMAEGLEKESYEPTYEDIQSLIARNGKKLTLEQKQDIIKTLLSDD
jgi:predicted transcriptional regulator